MKKTIAIILSLIISSAYFLGAAQAESVQKKRRVINGPARTGAAVKESSSPAKALLKSQEWIVYLVPVNNEEAKPQMDILSFSGSKFNSRNLSSRGFREFDYVLDEAADAVSWEASQALDSGEIASWHAELKDQSMRGVLSILKKDGAIEDLYFTTQAANDDSPAAKQPGQKPKKAH